MNEFRLEKLDELAARRIMNWQDYDGAWFDQDHHYKCEFNDYRPTRNIAEAWECLEKFDKSLEPTIAWESGEQVWQMAWWGLDGSNSATASTAAEAIVKGCLLAKGIKDV